MKTKLNLLAAGIFLAAANAGEGQPVITNQPLTQATALGTAATFTVGASGTELLTYPWQANPGTGFSDLTDRTNAVLTLPDVHLSEQVADSRPIGRSLSLELRQTPYRNACHPTNATFRSAQIECG
jgi:hypothetical protein